jgi:phytoene dehydrogenase-like protein
VDIRKDKVAEKTITPCDIEAKCFARRGAFYGISSTRKKDSFLSPSNVSKDIKGLYFVGGTTHPGGGSPMVTISGLNVAHHIFNENRKKSSKVF